MTGSMRTLVRRSVSWTFRHTGRWLAPEGLFSFKDTKPVLPDVEEPWVLTDSLITACSPFPCRVP